MFALGCIQALQCAKNTCPTGITTHNKELQRGLVPKEKAKRVTSFAETVVYGVGMIAHSCGVRQPRDLRRKHIRIVESGGISVSLDQLYPIPPVKPEYSGKTSV
jgi:glutamate synthase domain-containing protein 2